jgi:hypothetical protein
MMPCDHMEICAECWRAIKEKHGDKAKCPKCQRIVEDVLIYH